MRVKVIVIMFGGFWALSGCSTMSAKHSHVRGSVVTLDSSQEAHVCLGQAEVKPGDKLNVYESICKSEMDFGERKPVKKTVCDKISRGQAEVTDSLGEHFAKIRSLGDLKFKEGFIVEKKAN